ncbi:hypothetical protein WH50_24960 [Pokkaliibacter plantistimulans]|uniref:HPt domain-containing protein n=1 Tax=Pokkaliibacter plantistimulans TaxID=1635171 RepID=A0ABX5LPV4_9GAMM|nr:Hpt domain-containing protein [Pokkaliibacter plantistimulans]PXF28689.1 hypothetical protein WH50_24960 [Pokkaliibacter plantistimulans]
MQLDLALLSELQEVMDDEFVELIETYIDDSTLRLAQVKDAVERGDGVGLRQSAHSMKGSSSNIGATSLAEILKLLEAAGMHNNLSEAQGLMDAVCAEHLQVCAALKKLYLSG